MISMTLLAILCTAVISAYLFMGRNLERMMNTQKQGVASRRALQYFTSDVSSATALSLTSNATTANLTVTTPVSGTLLNCTVTSGSTSVTCTSTALLSAGMAISGTGIPSSATVSSVTNGTTFVLSASATASGSGLSLYASGGSANVYYVYDTSATPATFKRVTAGGASTTLLTNINTAATTPANGFAFYDENGNSVASSSAYLKAVEFAFSTTEGSSIAGTKSSYVVVSPRVILRNKAVLK